MIAYILFKIKKYKVILPTIIVSSILTLIFIYVFGVGFGQQYIPEVAIVDDDRSATSTAIIKQLMDNKSYSFQEESLATAMKSLEGKEIVGIVYFDKGFEQSLAAGHSRVSLYKNGVNVEVINLENRLKQYISEAINDSSFPSAAAEYLKVDVNTLRSRFEENRTGYITYTVKSSFFEKENGSFSMYKQSFAGFILFFSMFTIMFGIGSIVEEKEFYVWQRQMVSPLSTASILFGDLISNFIVSIAQMIAVILLSKALFHIEWGGSTLAILLVLGAYVFAGTALGLFVSCFVKTQQQLGAILPTVIVSTSMIGGTMWPREMMNNAILLNISNLLPQRWAMKGLLDVIMYQGGVKDVLQPILYLLIITAVLMLVSLKPYRRAV